LFSLQSINFPTIPYTILIAAALAVLDVKVYNVRCVSIGFPGYALLPASSMGRSRLSLFFQFYSFAVSGAIPGTGFVVCENPNKVR
jgi:hypothetical protein